jgi:hypothetical protein
MEGSVQRGRGWSKRGTASVCSGVLYGGSGEVRGDDAELKWQGVLGSVLKTTTKDPGGRRLFCWLGEGSLVRGRLVCVGRDKFRFRFFFCISPQMCKINPLHLCVLKATIYRKKMLLGLTLGPSTSFFCKFWFFLFFSIFLKTSNINIDSNEKNRWF